MASYSLLRGGYRSLNAILRPYSTAQCSFNGRSATAHPLRSPLVHDPHAGKHWTVERYLAIGLLAIIPGGILLESSVTDYLLAAALVVHANWGCRSIIVDYVHGKRMPTIALGLMYSVSLIAFIGLCYFNYYDMGLSKAIKKVWTL